MFFHHYKYGFLTCLRNTQELFWMLCFPILLSTLFHVAFSGITEKTEMFEPIPVAIVAQDGAMTDSFIQVMEQFDSQSEQAFFEITRASAEEANQLLLSGSVTGIFTTGDELSLTVCGDNEKAALQQSILESFLHQYLSRVSIITEIALSHPENLEKAISALSDEIYPNREFSYTDGNMDMFTQYFYNIIAMICIFSSMSSMSMTLGNQANLSALGARKCCSPAHKLPSTLSRLCASASVQMLCCTAALFYMAVILKADFGSRIPYLLLTIAAGVCAGSSIGFLVGSIGHMGETVKTAILMCFSMLCSFLSGLMAGNMRILVDNYCPLLNRLNPTALITDCFYALNIYDTNDRFYQNIATLLILSALMTAGGFLLTRRDRYASI